GHVEVAVRLQQFLLVTLDSDVLLTIDLEQLTPSDVEAIAAADQLLLSLFDNDVQIAGIILRLAVADQELHAPFNVLFLMALDVEVLILVNLLALVTGFVALLVLAPDDQMPVMTYAFHAIMLDAHVLVSLGMNEDLLLALGVVEAPFVVAGASGSRVTFHPAQ